MDISADVLGRLPLSRGLNCGLLRRVKLVGLSGCAGGLVDTALEFATAAQFGNRGARRRRQQVLHFLSRAPIGECDENRRLTLPPNDDHRVVIGGDGLRPTRKRVQVCADALLDATNS